MSSSQSKPSQSKLDRFNHLYETGETPWELNRPDKYLIQWVRDWPIAPCKALDIGCGTGFNAIWLSEQGFEVTGADFSPLAVQRAGENGRKSGRNISFIELDFLSGSAGDAPFMFLFDRGCFHSFDDPAQRAAFAKNAHGHLGDNGLWLSFLGNADAPPRDEGPPMRSALDIATAAEPWFEILSLTSAVFDSERETPARSWQCLMKKRAI
ncbi:MAG: class I SAM-dependent methyltransferase [Desulfobacterales bacterium]|nr:class I SAM-dependent methyltransferase [Desulfobacterales bacterium]